MRARRQRVRRWRHARRASRGGRAVHQPGLLVLPAGRCDHGQAGAASRRRRDHPAGDLLGSARLEGHAGPPGQHAIAAGLCRRGTFPALASIRRRSVVAGRIGTVGGRESEIRAIDRAGGECAGPRIDRRTHPRRWPRDAPRREGRRRPPSSRSVGLARPRPPLRSVAAKMAGARWRYANAVISEAPLGAWAGGAKHDRRSRPPAACLRARRATQCWCGRAPPARSSPRSYL